MLKYYYGTGGDLNVDEVNDVIPVTELHGLWHPQEGVFNGHFHPTEAEKVNRIGQLRNGVTKVIEDKKYSPSLKKKYTVADMITGFGVAKSVLHYYNIWGGTVENKKAIIQGWGNVGAAAAYFLASKGVRIIGIIDKHGGLINSDGYGLDEVKKLITTRNGNQLDHSELIPFDQINDKIWDTGSDIFVPAAASRLITKDQIDRLIKHGLEVVSCGANVPFADEEIFYGPICEHADKQVAVIPDFIANCGMARVFAYLMEKEVQIGDQTIFKDTSDTIKNALKKVYSKNPDRTLLTKTAFENSLNELISKN